ncbi:uncharacterized protein [Periplaneta americana]|uniref:uncharacterized protein n=1 Tax=Periplaneta americana TaxID=6978 RepID=UPI0037E700C6
MALLHFFLVALFCAILGHSRVLAQDQTQNEVEDEGNWKVLYRLITDCAQKSDMSVCLKMKAVTFLDRAITMKNPLLVNDYLSLARDPSYKDETVGPQGRSLKPLSEAQLEQSLPESLEERSERLDDMLQDKVDKFLQSRTVQLNFPADVFEGRRRKKGHGLLMAGGLAAAGMMAQLFMGKIALIAGKALLVAKIALVLSAIVGLKKLLGGGGGGGGGESHQVVYASGGHEHGGWQRRSLSSDPLQAHDMAYRAHKNED